MECVKDKKKKRGVGGEDYQQQQQQACMVGEVGVWESNDTGSPMNPAQPVQLGDQGPVIAPGIPWTVSRPQ